MNAKTTAAAKSADSKPVYATRNFTDDGTGKSFTLNEPIEATDGEIGNYRAAGLASDKKTTDDEIAEMVADEKPGKTAA